MTEIFFSFNYRWKHFVSSENEDIAELLSKIQASYWWYVKSEREKISYIPGAIAGQVKVEGSKAQIYGNEIAWEQAYLPWARSVWQKATALPFPVIEAIQDRLAYRPWFDANCKSFLEGPSIEKPQSEPTEEVKEESNETVEPDFDFDFDAEESNEPVIDAELKSFNGIAIGMRRENGFIHATPMCTAHGKKLVEWLRNQSTLELFVALSDNLGKSSQNFKDGNFHLSDARRLSTSHYAAEFPGLILTCKGSPDNGGGTWIHPDLAVPLAQWCNPTFAIQVSRWVQEWALKAAQKSQQQTQQKTYVRFNPEKTIEMVERTFNLFEKLGGADDRDKLALKDRLRNALHDEPIAAESGERLEWPISDRCIHLGYRNVSPLQLRVIGMRAKGLYVERYGEDPPKREQYVDGTTRMVNSYSEKDVDLLDRAIHAVLKQAGAS